MARQNYRQKKGKDAWHFCSNCSNWPLSEFNSKTSKPTSDEFCNQCLAKEKNNNCT